jgi:hypothetical protein
MREKGGRDKYDQDKLVALSLSSSCKNNWPNSEK